MTKIRTWSILKLILKFIGYSLLTYYIVLCGISNWTGKTQHIWFPWGSTSVHSYRDVNP